VQTTKLIFLIIPILLSGCVTAPLVLTGIGIGSVAVSETTGKSITDHTVSTVARQDCRIGRVFKNQDMCQDPGLIRLQVTNTGIQPSSIEDIESRYR
jgi:starvation-inducible outer membrane lipoprotein